VSVSHMIVANYGNEVPNLLQMSLLESLSSFGKIMQGRKSVNSHLCRPHDLEHNSKVKSLLESSQIYHPHLQTISSGLTDLTENFKY
jgi:hypothetical protein